MRRYCARPVSLPLVLATALACALAGCTLHVEDMGLGDDRGLIEEDLAEGSAQGADEGSGQAQSWLSYRLALDGLMEMDSSDKFLDVVFSADSEMTDTGCIAIQQLGDAAVLSNNNMNTDVVDPPAGSRYVLARLLGADGKIIEEDITEQAVGTIHLRASSGDEFEPQLRILWGIEYDLSSGFSTDEEQEGFCLLFVVPEDIALQDLRIAVSDS